MAKVQPRLRPMKMDLAKAVGIRTKRAREAAKLTQDQLAALIDRTKETISNIERGKNPPSLETLQLICDAAKVPMASMFEYVGEEREATELRGKLNASFGRLSLRDQKIAALIVEAMANEP